MRFELTPTKSTPIGRGDLETDEDEESQILNITTGDLHDTGALRDEMDVDVQQPIPKYS